MIRSIFVLAVLCRALVAQSATPASDNGKVSPSGAQPAVGATKAGGAPMHYRPARFAGRAGTYYRLVWGVDGLSGNRRRLAK